MYLLNTEKLTYLPFFQLEGVHDDWEEIIDDLIAAFEKQHKRKLTYYISFY
jgi:RNA polymerase II subunit A C-terminal domain phosphatase SSU72